MGAAPLAKDSSGRIARVSPSPREPDAPRPRGQPQAVDGDATAVLLEAAASSRGGSRADIDNALHGIGLALDALLDGVRLPEDRNTAAAEHDVRSRVRSLLADAELDALGVDVLVDGGRVTLLGRVGDPLSRLIAEDLAWSLPNVNECDNRLAVG